MAAIAVHLFSPQKGFFYTFLSTVNVYRHFDFAQRKKAGLAL
jgi:hypothetical protein